MWINLDDKELALVKEHLRAACQDDSGIYNASEALLDKIVKAEEVDPADDAYRNAVETDDELEVDHDAIVSAGADPGAWVHAWIWVTDAQAGIEPEDEDEEDDADDAEYRGQGEDEE